MTRTTPTTQRERFLEGAAVAAAARSAADGRTLLGAARGFAAWTDLNDVDPLYPTETQVRAFIAERGYKQASKVRWALRASLRAAGSLADEHGLGTGSSTGEFDGMPARARAVIDGFLGTITTRHSVWRSGMRKLVRWCVEMEIDLLEVSPPDLDDYRGWIRVVGGDEGELLVIARRFLVQHVDA